MKKFLLFFILITGSVSAQSVCTATVDGDWANASTWSCPGGPACGSTVIIPVGITVTITSQQNYAACSPTPAQSLVMGISGCLKFVTGNKLTLPCGTQVYLSATGSLVPGNGSGNSNYMEICTNIVWNAAAGTATGPVLYCANPPCSFLPVEFVAFTGDLEQKIVNLYWKTQTETNNNYFEIEKSADGINFEKIGTIKSKSASGTSINPLEYEFIDKDLKHPTYYYRLKQVDLNGDFKRTNSISVKIYAAEFSIFPNPNTGVFSIDVPSVVLHEELTVKIYSSIGKLVHESTEYVKNHNITGSRVDVVPTQILPKGIYLSTISFKGETHQLKLVVQ